MKALFGVAVFGLIPVPPMPACDAGADSPDDRPAAAEDLKQFRLEPHANDNEQDEPAPDPVEDNDAGFTQIGDAPDDLIDHLPPISMAPAPENPP